MQVLLHDRDEHMVHQLAKLSGRVVGVVGLAHLDGMQKRWEQLQAVAANSSNTKIASS